MENTKIKRISRWIAILAGFSLALYFSWQNGLVQGQIDSATPDADIISDLNQRLQEKRDRLEQLQKESASYQQSVDQAASTVRDLNSQITTIENQISLTNFEIQSKQTEVEKIQLEMEIVQGSIDEKNEAITTQKSQLAEALKLLEQTSQTPLLSMVVLNTNFSDFFDAAQAYSSISDSLQESVTAIQRLKEELQAKYDLLDKSKAELEQAKLQLEINRQSISEQRDLQETLLSSAQESESQYNDLLQQAMREEQQANATISSLEQEIQIQLSSGDDSLPVFSSKGFIWPVRGTITAYFHDSTYPFRCSNWSSPYCMEHSGLDLGVAQGTPVRAIADGLVSVMNDQGWYYNTDGQKTRSALNFVGLVHEDGLSSRYLHLSAIYVHPDQFVKQGEVIGLSGGMPGTAGAGGMTTGPHLHLEIRVDGIPDDPLRYLE